MTGSAHILCEDMHHAHVEVCNVQPFLNFALGSLSARSIACIGCVGLWFWVEINSGCFHLHVLVGACTVGTLITGSASTQSVGCNVQTDEGRVSCS